MAGKSTFRHGRHSSREGGIVGPIQINPDDIERLQSTLGRDLSNKEADRIANALAHFKNLKLIHLADHVATQDIKRTLAAIAKLSAEEAIDAKENCDEITSTEIDQSLWFECGLRGKGTDALERPPAELIPKAAQFALSRLNERENAGGRPEKGYQKFIAEFALNSWRDFGRSDMKFWLSEGHLNRAGDDFSYSAPLLRWAATMFQIVDGTADFSRVRTLLSEAMSREG